MPQFSIKSQEKLETCDKDLQTVFNEVIKHFDCAILYGYRTPLEQLELYKKGRELAAPHQWVIKNKNGVVTYKDGFKNKSKHNYTPSQAVDVIPYPVNFKDTRRMDYFAGFVMGIAKIFKAKGIIDKDIIWGGDWNDNTKTDDENFVDGPHFQTKN